MTAPPQSAPAALLQSIITDSLNRVLAARIRQVVDYGHSPAADDAAGPHRLIAISYAKLNRIMHGQVSTAQRETQSAMDMTHGDAAFLSAQERRVLDGRLASAAACILAAMDALDRIPVKPENPPSLSPPSLSPPSLSQAPQEPQA